jgi:hypothetical protein
MTISVNHAQDARASMFKLLIILRNFEMQSSASQAKMPIAIGMRQQGQQGHSAEK